MEEQKSKKNDNRIILYCFIGFFATFMILDSIFVYLAVSTQTGVVTEQPYEKGLDYNNTLAEAKNQPVINDEVSYKDGILTWVIKDNHNMPVNGHAKATFFRPVQEGYDFMVPLESKGHGVYEIKPDLPLKGLWSVRLQGQWNSKIYKTSFKLIYP